jgi:hypothetical protein
MNRQDSPEERTGKYHGAGFIGISLSDHVWFPALSYEIIQTILGSYQVLRVRRIPLPLLGCFFALKSE